MDNNRSLADLNKLSLWLKVVLLNFLFAAIIGASLRLAFVVEIPGFEYRHFMHAHSHLALLGWLFGGFYVLIIYSFGLAVPRYERLFWACQICIIGMTISFPMQGYGAFSIFFSSAHIICSYFFAARVFRDVRHQSRDVKAWPAKFLYTALFFLVLASLGTWALGPIMNSPLKGGAWYYSAIQFFLHFQFNGWFVFVVLAIFFKVISDQSDMVFDKRIRAFFVLLIVSCVLTYALAVTWSTPDNFLFYTNSLGVLLQVVAWSFFSRWIWQQRHRIRKILVPRVYFLWTIAFMCLTLKIIIQTCVAVPTIAVLSYTIHNFVIGFIHLLMLGGLSVFIFGFLEHISIWKSHKRLMQRGLWLFLAGVALTEGLLFYQGIRIWFEIGFIPFYYEILFSISILLPAGILLYTTGVFRNHGKSQGLGQ